jgi:hypothetical protein
MFIGATGDVSPPSVRQEGHVSPNGCMWKTNMALLTEGGSVSNRVYKHGPTDGGRLYRSTTFVKRCACRAPLLITPQHHRPVRNQVLIREDPGQTLDHLQVDQASPRESCGASHWGRSCKIAIVRWLGLSEPDSSGAVRLQELQDRPRLLP